ncbi:MAG: ribosomal-protein-S18-alanine acetyltransferase [Dehalococcoidia bacterium]|nr:ribosomal-protein-S18-alanine acetyltransferase [Dehalococcoidia bacterium]
MIYSVRTMTETDIPQLVEIEREAFPNDWPPISFQRELNTQVSHFIVAVNTQGGSPAQPSESSTPEHILGYAGLWIFLDESHLISIAVRQTYRGQGIGELLLRSALELSVRRGAQMMALEVRESNHPAQSLYTKYGFIKKGIRRGYYPDNNEDAFIMVAESIH